MHQHRFVLPMWSEEVRHFLAALEHEPYGFMLGDQGESAGWVLPGVATDEPAPLRELCRAQPALSAELLAELPMAVVVLSAPDAIPALSGHSQVDAVSVSVVVPSPLGQPMSEEFH